MSFYRYWLRNVKGTKFEHSFAPSTIRHLIREHGHWPEKDDLITMLDNHSKKSIKHKLKTWLLAKERGLK